MPGRSQYDRVGVSKEQFAHSVFVDADYLFISSHLYEGTKRKIEASQYVDFGRLLPRDRIDAMEDNRMVLVNNNGEQFYQPYADKVNLYSIDSYAKWELAFRVSLRY